METKVVHLGQYLFKVGDPDDSIYVVQTGEITVSIREPVSVKIWSIINESHFHRLRNGNNRKPPTLH